jgi:hypothetical protein
MSIKSKIIVSFELESLKPLEKDSIANEIGEKLQPKDSDNFFSDQEGYAIFDENSLSIKIE